MAFHSVTEFLQMGGYAGFVWAAYSICLLGFTINAVKIKSKKGKLINKLRDIYEPNS